MEKLLGNGALPNYVKLTATGILSLTYLAALFVALQTYMQYGPSAQLPSVVTFVLGTGLSMALGILGQHVGTSALEKGQSIASTPTA